MTSIEWLWEEIDNLIPYEGIATSQIFRELLVKAEEMHKQEIIDAYMERVDSTNKEDLRKIIGEQYYQETFKKD